MRLSLYVLGFLIVIASGACEATKQNEREGGSAGSGNASATRDRTGDSSGMLITGTVRHVDLGGGFYGIETDDGMKLDPVNLPEDFQEDGVRIRLRVEWLEDRVSIRMWGRIVCLLSIERL